MLIISLFLVAAIAVLCLISGDESDKTISDYCNVECKQNIQNKYKFCC